jgi:allantoin racemase
MRIRYLSLSNSRFASNYYPFLRDYLDRVSAPDTEIEMSGSRVGRIDSYRFFAHLDTISILDQVLDAEQQGFDAVAIGNIFDPGLREARSMVDIPVLGLAETCMLVACMMGNRFSLVAVNPGFVARFEEHVARAGLTERLASIECMHLSPHELDRCFSEPEYHQRGIDEFSSAAQRTIDAGAEVVIPAGGRLTAFLNANDVRSVGDVPVIDGTATLVAMTEAAVRLRAITGRFVSRKGAFEKAPDEIIREVAEEYGESYLMPSLTNLKGK